MISKEVLNDIDWCYFYDSCEQTDNQVGYCDAKLQTEFGEISEPRSERGSLKSQWNFASQ